MKLTKKQITALERITSYEREANERNNRDGGAGLHPSEDKFIVTDGITVVVFDEQSDQLELASRIDFYSKYIRELVENADGIRANQFPTVADCKQAIKKWKQMTNLGKPTIPKVEVRGTLMERGYIERPISAWFDARHMLNALEAMGSNTAVFIEKDAHHKLPYPYVTIYREEGRAPFKSVVWNGLKAIVLPCRPD